MTVSSSLNRKEYVGNGATVAFATSPVVFFDEGDLTVYLVVTATGVATLQTITTHYTVSGGDGAAGTVTMVTAPTASQTLVIVRELDIVQEVDFVNNEATDAEVAEDALDKLTMMAQQNAAAIARSFRLADSDVSGASTELPTPAASELIGWNSGATALTSYPAASIADTIIPTAFAETLLDDTTAAEARTTLDAQQDVFTTRGDLVRAGASGVAERVALGTSGYVLASNGTDAVWTAANSLAAPLPRSYLSGCKLSNNGSDATNDIDVAAGVCRDSTNAVNVAVAALTKRLDANWAAGTNQGMRYSGAAIANTTYHLWAVATAAGTQDIYATPNASASTASAALTLLQAESGGSSYVYARRIGSILRESAAIVAFVQNGDEFQRSVSVLDINANAPGTSAVTRTLSVPLGVRVKAIVVGQAENAGTLQSLLLSDLSVTDETPATSTILAQSTSESTNYGVMPLAVWTNTSAQIRSRVESSGASADLRIRTFGWIDRRGKDD